MLIQRILKDADSFQLDQGCPRVRVLERFIESLTALGFVVHIAAFGKKINSLVEIFRGESRILFSQGNRAKLIAGYAVRLHIADLLKNRQCF